MTIGTRDAITGTTGNDTPTMEVDGAFSSTANALNRFTGERVSVSGLNRSFDTYSLGAGNDTLNGTSGNDALFHSTAGSTRTDTNGANVASSAHFTAVERFAMGLGDDVLDMTAGANGASGYFGGGVALLVGDIESSASSGTLGADVLRAGSTVLTTLVGDAGGTLEGTAVGGDDRLTGNAGTDTMRGETFTFRGSAVGGDDVLLGLGGNDTMYGDADNVQASAVCGDDRLTGGSGNDTLYGDGSTITSTGARGADTFDFDTGSGQDTVGDFQHGTDTIRIDPSYGFDDFADLAITGATNAVIALNGTTDQITLTGVSAATLDAGDFEFIA